MIECTMCDKEFDEEAEGVQTTMIGDYEWQDYSSITGGDYFYIEREAYQCPHCGYFNRS